MQYSDVSLRCTGQFKKQAGGITYTRSLSYKATLTHRQAGRHDHRQTGRQALTRKDRHTQTKYRSPDVECNLGTGHSLCSRINHRNCILPGGIPEVVIHGDKITTTTTATMGHKTDGVSNNHNTHCDDNDERDNLSSDVSS